MAHSFRDADHLPKQRNGTNADPDGLPRQRNGTTPQMHGRYPDFDVMQERERWDPVTREVLDQRVGEPPECRFFDPGEQRTLAALFDVILAQDREPRVPVLQMIDAKLHDGQLDGYRYASMPDDPQTLKMVAARLEGFADLDPDARRARVKAFSGGELDWEGLDVKLAWKVVTRLVVSAFYSHPWAFNEIGFRGPAYPRGYMRRNMGPTGTDPDEPQEAAGLDPVTDLRA